MSRVFKICIYIVAVVFVSSASVAATENEKAPTKDSAEETNVLKQIKDDGEKTKGAPVYIKSDSLSLNAKDRVFIYRDNVQIVRDQLTITSDSAVGKYDENNEIQEVTCEGNIVITKGDTLRANSDHAVYDVKKQIIELTEGPELINETNALIADKIILYVDEDRSEAEGAVRVKVLNASSGDSKGILKDGTKVSSEPEKTEAQDG